MSTRYPGGIITKTPVVPTGPYDNGTAPGIWTLDQQLQATKSGIWPTAGNVDPSQFIENIFSTYLYAGTGAALTITNGIDLSGKGGLVWLKQRTAITWTAYTYHALFDSARGPRNILSSNDTSSSSDAGADTMNTFNSNGFSLGNDSGGYGTNKSTETYASWTFREQPKFFDIVTYTGTGANTTIAHNLGSVPGMIIVKRTDTTGAWQCYHRSLANTQYMVLNDTAAVATGATRWNSTTPTSSVFSLGTDATVNASAGTYVAYLFAHDAGGFGLTGTDNVISCGSFTTDGSGNATVSLGYEPQWLMFKKSSATGAWNINDSMRGFTVRPVNSNYLFANSSGAELDGGQLFPTATGFTTVAGSIDSSTTYIYIAIRRGPMKVPTDATKVFAPVLVTSSAADQNVDAGFPVDLVGIGWRNAALGVYFVDRLRGITSSTTPRLAPPSTAAEQLTNNISGAYQTGVTQYTGGSTGYDFVDWFFRRAPGFFDVVCYTGTGTTLNPSHNLGVVPELKIIKNRTLSIFWTVGGSAITGGTQNDYIVLNSDAAKVANSTYWSSGSDTSTTFSTRTGNAASNDTGYTFVAYLFATVAGVSKVGTYTGTGTTLQINCGFTAGSRFVLIKRTDSTGDWYVWDSARGIVAGNDPYLLLNSTAAEVTGTDYVDTYSAGFEISSTAPAAINANGGSFVFLAIA